MISQWAAFFSFRALHSFFFLLHLSPAFSAPFLTSSSSFSTLLHLSFLFFLSLPSILQIFLNANTIRLGNLPHGTTDPLLAPGTTYAKQTVYEVCVCPSGKLYLSPAESASTCQTTNSVCLWS